MDKSLLSEMAIYRDILKCAGSWWYDNRASLEAAGLPKRDPLFHKRPAHTTLTWLAERGLIAFPQGNAAPSHSAETEREGAAALRKLNERQNALRTQQV